MYYHHSILYTILLIITHTMLLEHIILYYNMYYSMQSIDMHFVLLKTRSPGHSRRFGCSHCRTRYSTVGQQTRNLDFSGFDSNSSFNSKGWNSQCPSCCGRRSPGRSRRCCRLFETQVVQCHCCCNCCVCCCNCNCECYLEETNGTFGKGTGQKIGMRYVSTCFDSRCLQPAHAQGVSVTACDAGGLMGFLACCLATLLFGWYM